MSNILVTGGAGFIGSNITERLVMDGHKVRVIDNLSTGRMENISGFLDRIEFVEGDIRDLKVVKKVMDGVEFVLHQAALPSVLRSIEDPISTNDVNIRGTLNVLVAAKGAKVKRLVYASSSSVYGNNLVLPKKEDMKEEPISPYGITKLVGEKYCEVFYHVYGLETISLRYFNVFGKNQDPTSQYSAVIPRFITKMLKEEQPIIYGDGEQSRDFTFVENVVSANLLACFSPNGQGKVFNIACGKRITVNELVKTINEILETNIEPTYTSHRTGDVRHSQAEISKAQEVLGYEPIVDFKEGLKRTIEWYRDQMSEIRS
ncbi:MAG: SDR family oxidoreductase [bacterium]|nr:SDR family oxidoreductase [bacterium]